MSRPIAVRGQLAFDFVTEPPVPVVFSTDARTDLSRQEPPSWLVEIPMLLSRYSSLGIGADVAQMSIDELLGVHRFLTRLKKQDDKKAQREGVYNE